MKIKLFILIAISCLLTACTSKRDGKTIENIEHNEVISTKKVEPLKEENQVDTEIKDFKAYNVNDTITVDLNGDNISDQTYFNTIKDIKKVIIIDGKTKKQMVVGNDISFKDIGSNFIWVDSWGITDVNETYSNVVVDGELINGIKV